MKNSDITKRFLSMIDVATQDQIVTSVAEHYGVSKEDAREEITGVEAEHLLDYLQGPIRAATSALMQRHGLAVG